MRITKVQISWVWCQKLMKSAQNVLESQDSVGRNSFSSSTINHQIQVFKRQTLMCLFWRARLLRSWCLPASLILSLNPLPQIHDSPPILVCLSSSKEVFGLQPLHISTGYPAWHGCLTFHLPTQAMFADPAGLLSSRSLCLPWHPMKKKIVFPLWGQWLQTQGAHR